MRSSASNLRVLGASFGDPNDPRVLSGAPKHLLDAVEARVASMQRVDYSDGRLRRAALGAITYHPDEKYWRERYLYGPVARGVRSRALRRQLRSVQFDVAIQVRGWMDPWERPAVLYCDQTFAMAQREWPPWVPRGGAGRLEEAERRLFGSLRHIFTVSEAARQSLINDYGLAPDDVTTVGGGVNFSLPPPNVWKPASEMRILFVGRDWRRKGGDVLVEAFQQVKQTIPNAQLIIVGTHAPMPQPDVTVLGEVASREQLSAEYHAASLVCLPSRYEPYGFAAIEAMAHGVPCVVSTAIDSSIVSDHTGRRVPVGDAVGLADALLTVLTSPAEAERMSVAGLTRVKEELNWDTVAARMIPRLELC